MNLILSCLKQTLTLAIILIIPTKIKSPEVVNGAEETPVAEVTAVAEEIAKTTQLLNICMKMKGK